MVDQPTNGSVTVNTTTGQITYTPNNGFTGTDTLVYQICDDGTPLPATCDTAMVVITVLPCGTDLTVDCDGDGVTNGEEIDPDGDGTPGVKDATQSTLVLPNSTSSIHPVASKIEIRKEGKLGRVYYPAPYLTNENVEYYEDAYEVGPEKIIATYAAATQHVDQGLSLTLFFKDTATTRDINKAQISAWKAGIKTIYYIRIRQMALEGTEVSDCVSCML